ncbi:RNA 2',3'-cyclic phosphodiesterase [Rhodanobacter umsongensis]
MPIRQTLPETRQFDLLGGGVASTEVHRLFFALMPDDATRERLVTVAGALRASRPGLRARWIHPDRYHAPLHFLGDHAALRPGLVEDAIAAADKLRAASFNWTLDGVTSFRGREPPCVLHGVETCAPLQALWSALGKTLALAGQGARLERSFTPHVTLAYSHGTMLESAEVDAVEWPVTDFVLVHSVVGQGGYQTLGRWPLTGQ